METVSEPTNALERVLQAGRQRFNERFQIARRAWPKLAPEVFLAHLRETVGPLCEQVAQRWPDCARPVAEALYDLSLELIGREILGPNSRYSAVNEGWRRLMPGLPHLLRQDAEAFAGLITNALYNLSLQPTARPQEWISLMSSLGTQCQDLSVFAECGKIAAWRGGMAHFRQGALDSCGRLDPGLARSALGLRKDAPLDLPDILKQLAVDPWLVPARLGSTPRKEELRIVATAGGFRGFGGPFLTPPDVVHAQGRFVVFDAESSWYLYADVFGTTLLRADTSRLDVPPLLEPALQVNRQGVVTGGGQSKSFPELAEASSWASDAATLAVTVPLSHEIFLVALAEAE